MGANLSKGKSNKSTTNSFADLSDPLIANIISLLPLKSVLRCRTVCKAWHQSIAGINFNSIYQKGEDNAYMTVVTRSPCNEYNLFEFNMKGSMFESAASVKPVKFVCEFSPRQGLFKFVGSCNGLMCMTQTLHADLPYYIWNPLLGEYISVPDPRGKRKPHFLYVEHYGFGYCPITKEYKILKADSEDNNLEVMTICANTTTTWRSLGKTCCIPRSLGFDFHYLNGVIHWICRCIDDETILNWIYCFDCETEKLSSLHPPSDCSHFHQSKLVTFTVLRNRLCLVHLFDDDIVLWLMEDYDGVAESWTKMSFHNQFHETPIPPKPLILREDKNLLFLEWCSGSFCYYDDDKKVYVNSRTALRKIWNLYAFCYIPSFVPLLEVFKKKPSKMLIQHSEWLGSLLNATGLRKTQ